ncbi:unnamed protein product [Allacma fusca]|uniref:Uncharacterized protein n=1 Tax=Allacma fusca TaxID=39272 RepID=A0A8J2L581_9HEXA|nr:unnamed protein product [Allacma fusca]
MEMSAGDEWIETAYWMTPVVILLVGVLNSDWWRNRQLYKAFKEKHVITTTDEPDHRFWSCREWNEYVTSQGLSDRRVNTIISVDHEEDLMADFNPILRNLFAGHNRNGDLYKSRNPRMIYHMLRTSDRDDFEVYYHNRVHYVAAVRKIDSKMLPIHFKQRYALQIYQLEGISVLISASHGYKNAVPGPEPGPEPGPDPGPK